MPQVPKRLSYSFVIGLALFVVCLIYIPQWRHYAPSVHQSVPTSPYLTPWTVVSVSRFKPGSCSHLPLQSAHSIRFKSFSQRLFPRWCSVLLRSSCWNMPAESASRTLDIFFLPDSSGQRATLYAARPTPHSATTSLLFAVCPAAFFTRIPAGGREHSRSVFWPHSCCQPSHVLAISLHFFFHLASSLPGLDCRSQLSFSTSCSVQEFSGSPLALTCQSLPSSRPVKTFRRWV